MGADRRHESVGELGAAAARDRHAALLHRDGDHLRHVARARRFRAEPRVQHPGRDHSVRPRRREGLLQPVARRDQQPPGEVARSGPAVAPDRLEREARALARPQLRAEDPESEVGVREEAVEHRPPLRAELSGIALGGAQEKGAVAFGERCRRGMLGVQILEPVPRELVAELRVRRPAHPQRMPGAEHVVLEPGHGDLGGLDGAAEPVVSLEHAHVPPAPREESRAREAVDAAPDDDRVVVSQRSPETRRR